MCSQAGRGVTIVSSSSSPIGAALGGVDPNKPLPICTGPAPSSPIPAAVVTAAHMPPGQHPKVLMHVTSQMTVNQARNAVRTGKISLYLSHANALFKGNFLIHTSNLIQSNFHMEV